jgi:hypothetical protein
VSRDEDPPHPVHPVPGRTPQQLTAHLRTRRVIRHGARIRLLDGPGRPGILNTCERPAEAVDRAVPGRGEGDAIFGERMSPLATLVNARPGS